MLTLFPTKDQFSGTLLRILRDIPILICEMAQPMENIAKGWLGHEEEKQDDAEKWVDFSCTIILKKENDQKNG